MLIKKILLIIPPAITSRNFRDINPLPPLGLGYLASVIKGLDLGIEVEILDTLMLGWNNEVEVESDFIRVGLSDEEIVRRISSLDVDIVGVSCQFSRQYNMYHRLFALIKKATPNAITIAGGAHVTVCPEEVLKDSNCDFVLIGEAEDSFRDFIVKLTQGKDISAVDGLGWKDNGRLRINSKINWIKDLDSIPFPAYDIMNLEAYFGLKSSHGQRNKYKFSPIVTSRGCPSKCTFCSAFRVWGNNFRFRSVDNVLKEMRILRNDYGVEEIVFEDDNVTANPRRAEELFSRMIDEKLNFTWDTPNGVGAWFLNEHIIDLMKQSGCVRLNFPVESGSQRVLDNIIKKPVKLSRVKRLMRYCRKIRLDYGIFLVIGLPGETINDIWKSFRFAASCGCYSPFISVATPYPGSELFDNCMKNNYFSKSFDLEDLYIRSYLIKTENWDENDLKKVFKNGCLYLSLMNALAHPVLASKKIFRKLNILLKK